MVSAFEELKRQGIPARVVSMPSWELFERQEQAYRDDVLPPNVPARVSVEMGSVIGWDRYVGTAGARVGILPVFMGDIEPDTGIEAQPLHWPPLD